MKKEGKREWIRLGAAAAVCALVLGLTACGSEGQTVSKEPVTVTLWHYYNDAQKDGLDEIVSEYNNTVGKEKKITVNAVGLGSVEDITTKVDAVLNGSQDNIEKPNMFLAYRDMLQEVMKKDNTSAELLNFRDYFTVEELDGYYPDFLEEGEFGEALYIMPVAKSTELLFMNQTMLDLFFEAHPEYSAKDLETWEAMAKMAETFYEWTDEMTLGVSEDGKALIGLDNFSNYFIAQNNALGSDIYETDEDGGVTFHLEEDDIKKLFENYYIPYTKGYYGGKEKYRSDDMRQDNLYGYVGSVASVAYFPHTIYGEDDSEQEIAMGIYPYPYFEGENKAAIQQGAGIAALSSTEAENQAVAEFIKWVSSEKGVDYAAMLSYMPTSKESVEAADWNVIEDENLREAVTIGMEQVKNYEMVRGFDFEGAYEVRMNLEDCFKEAVLSGREEYLGYLASGMTADEAAEAMQYDEKSAAFYEKVLSLFGQK
ncbi:MAG: extracellular solute-binding protein [Lachnospiraceae bacterium]|nr:extracellular solute-binding protein [Lachnospiraceae bacterium]